MVREHMTLLLALSEGPAKPTKTKRRPRLDKINMNTSDYICPECNSKGKFYIVHDHKLRTVPKVAGYRTCRKCGMSNHVIKIREHTKKQREEQSCQK
jgi:rubredoxin